MLKCASETSLLSLPEMHYNNNKKKKKCKVPPISNNEINLENYISVKHTFTQRD